MTTQIYGYIRSKGGMNDKIDTDGQTASIKMILQLHGHVVGAGNWKREVTYNGDTVIKDFLLKNAKPGDVIAVAKPSCIHPDPSQLIEIAGQFLAKGINLLVADQPAGKLDLQVLRSLSEPLSAMQAHIDALQKELQEKAAEHQKEFSTFQKGLEKQVGKYLADRGITLAHLLKPERNIEGGSPVPRPEQGSKVRELREKLHLNQSEAGALVTPPLDKAAVSRIESQGSGAPRYSDLSVALDIEYVLKNEEAKQRARGVNPRGSAPEDPRVQHIKDAVLGKLTDGLSQIERDWADAQAAASKIAT